MKIVVTITLIWRTAICSSLDSIDTKPWHSPAYYFQRVVSITCSEQYYHMQSKHLK